MTTPLCPTQRQVCDRLLDALSRANVLVLESSTGMGKTTLLHEVHDRHGGILLSMKDFIEVMRARHPLALEEAFHEWVAGALATSPCVLLDDLDLLGNVVTGGCNPYPRSGFLEVALSSLASRTIEAGKKLILATGGYPGSALSSRGRIFSLPPFTPEDYAFLCRHYLGVEHCAPLDFSRIHRFAPALNVHQLRSACTWISPEEASTTEGFIEYLRSQHLTSNVDLNEVQNVSLSDLHGVAEVVESLECNVVLPLENDQLAQELGLKPKRGVLLLGPPGTGKTTVGRALAHRLRGKFFLLDGTVISGTGNFYWAVHNIFEQAKHNAPAVIFIDDSDVIFESGSELGLYRYLLTMLDGLESTSAARVCVMMTAMNVAALPPALLRSGRVELWLEMLLPDLAARRAILTAHLTPRPAALAEVNVDALAEASDGFTGADLKRLCEDGKNLFAFDVARSKPLRPATDYFLDAVRTLRENRARYAEADALARRQRPQRPVYFDVTDGAASN
jgi:SpoVK/Ycf46/Vps4 family AAA+-type ATPase